MNEKSGPRETLPAASNAAAVHVKHVWVVFDTPGVQAIGPHKPGVPTYVTEAEGERLTQKKGFRYTEAPLDSPKADTSANELET